MVPTLAFGQRRACEGASRTVERRPCQKTRERLDLGGFMTHIEPVGRALPVSALLVAILCVPCSAWEPQAPAVEDGLTLLPAGRVRWTRPDRRSDPDEHRRPYTRTRTFPSWSAPLHRGRKPHSGNASFGANGSCRPHWRIATNRPDLRTILDHSVELDCWPRKRPTATSAPTNGPPN